MNEISLQSSQTIYALYTNPDLGEMTPDEHSTNLSVMNRKGTNHSAVFSHMITQCVQELPLNWPLQ